MRLRIVLLCVCCLAVQKTWAGNPSSRPTSGTSSSDNPYRVIFERNVFHLNPQPIPVPYEPPPPPLPDIKICGFVVEAGHARALFACVPKDAKQPELYYDLTEGERDGILQLVKIHLAEQAAEVINSGVPMTLTLRENGFGVPAVKPGGHVAGGAQRPAPRG